MLSTAFRSGRGWWGLFGLLIATPALALSWLGLRVVGAERIELEQQRREQQTQFARLAETAIEQALVGIETDLRSTETTAESGDARRGELANLPIMSFRRSGLLTFPRDRIYFGGWKLVFSAATALTGINQRLWLWYGFIGLLLVMLLTGVAMTTYSVRHEVELGRRQSDFVAAVSHEFKSPITSIRVLMVGTSVTSPAPKQLTHVLAVDLVQATPRVVLPWRVTSGMTGWRQTISTSAMVSLLIWSSGEYFVAAASAAYAGHATSWPAAAPGSPIVARTSPTSATTRVPGKPGQGGQDAVM